MRGAVVLLPNYHVAQQLAQALSSLARHPVLLLPQMVTLSDWAQSIPLSSPVQPDTQRIAVLYQALRERRWFTDADLWSLSRELLALTDELTRHSVTLPETVAEFAGQLAKAYRARSGQAMQFEARVVHELWFAMASGNEMDGVRSYQLRLAQLALKVNMPLYVLQTCEPAAPDARFLDACRTHVPVTVFDTRKMSDDAPDCALLVQALMGADLRCAAALLSKQHEAALKMRLQLFAAHGLEQEALAADWQIRSWLQEGKRSIAVVVQDRLVARRVRALLERSQVLVRDETGWMFATLSVSTVLMRWLDVQQNDFYYQDVLDLFKSPFLFADVPANERKQSAWQFEQMVRKSGAVAHLENFLDIAGHKAPELVKPLVRMRQAMQALPKRNSTLTEWLHALNDSLDILGVVQGWGQDAAGRQLLQLLALWEDELCGDTTRFSLLEWRRWLAQQLDSHIFRDAAVDSPVLFTHLAATRWRRFDAVLLLGCDAGHLPAPANVGQCFNDAVRATLGLPTSSTEQQKVCCDLLGLMAMNDNVLVTWQQSKNGEPNLLSPYFEMLRALHLLAYGDDLMVSDFRGQRTEDRVLRGAPLLDDCRIATTKPLSSVLCPLKSDLLPLHISPSGYNSLMACPYQFYARHVLRLNDLDEVREELDQRDYGTWVHELLQRFHSEYPIVSNHAREYLEAKLQRISREVFADALAHDYLAEAWLLRWLALIPAYLDWQLENEQSGWFYLESEAAFNIEVTEKLNLRGRIDRIDRSTTTELCVLDYKTQSSLRLKSKLKEAGEDVQLACYAYVRKASQAAFVSLEGDQVIAVAPTHDMAELARLNIIRLQTVFGQMRDGATMPAHGAEEACLYCEMKGLCRRHWQEEAHG